MSSLPVKLGVCTRYDQQGASSRLRYYDFLPFLREAGYEPVIRPFFGRRYLDKLYRTGRKSSLAGLLALLRRLTLLPGLPERLIVEYELLPQLTAKTELRLLGKRRYILNFDDNVWEKYAANPRLNGKYDELVAAAAGVIVGNDFLAARVGKLNSNWIKIPTVIDLERYRMGQELKRKKLTLCWIGTPVTYDYLEGFRDTLRAMAQQVDFDLLVIGGRQLSARAIPGVSMHFEDWSRAREVELIRSCHIGIMPLPDDDFARGKSAYKLIQYLGAGLPVIGSPVGENRRLIDSSCGFLADSPAEWLAALQFLADPANRAELAAGVERRAAEFSLQKFGPVYADFVRRSFHDLV